MSNLSKDSSKAHERIRPFRLDLLITSITIHLLGLMLPLALLQIYDRILPSQSYGTAAFLVVGVGVAIVLEAILRFGRQALFIGIGARYEAHAMSHALDRLQNADINAVEQRGTAAISDAFRSVTQVRDFWSGQAGVALYELPFVILYVALIAYIGSWLAVIPLVLFLLALIFAWYWNPKIVSASARVEHSDRQRRDFIWSLFGALEYLKAIGSEANLSALWRRRNHDFMVHSAEQESRMAWIRENATGIGQLSTVLIVTFGAGMVINGQITTGALAACTMLAGRSIGPAMASLGYWAQLARVSAAQEKVQDLLNLPLNSAFSQEHENAASVDRGEISITAPGLLSEPVTINPGDVVHLSTMFPPLASRLLTAVSGMSDDPEIHIKVDGQPIGKYPREAYRESVMLVSRHLALVPGSILNNLTLYDPRYNAEVQQFSEALGLQPLLTGSETAC